MDRAKEHGCAEEYQYDGPVLIHLQGSESRYWPAFDPLVSKSG